MESNKLQKRGKTLSAVRKQYEWDLYSAMRDNIEALNIRDLKLDKYKLTADRLDQYKNSLKSKYAKNSSIDPSELLSIKECINKYHDELASRIADLEEAEESLTLTTSALKSVKNNLNIVNKKEEENILSIHSEYISKEWALLDEMWLSRYKK